MKRREFLAGSLAAMAVRPHRPRLSGQEEEWSFTLDGELRWSLARAGQAPAVSRAVIAVELAGAPGFALSDLEDVRRMRSETRAGVVTLVVGRREAVEVTAEFQDGNSPSIAIRVRGLDVAQDLVAIRFAQGVSLGRRAAWISGYETGSPCEVVRGTGETTGHWQLALLGDGAPHPTAGAPSLAMMFGEWDGGDGQFRVSGGRIAVVSSFGHRAVGAAHPPAAASLTILPGGDPFERLAARAAAVRGALPGEVPAGWCSQPDVSRRLTEDDVLANLAAARTRLDPRSFRLILLADGYQRSAGDWETNQDFPHGHRWLTDRIHAAGFQAGLYLAPFAVTERSGIPAAHPEWLLHGPDGSLLSLDERPQWGGRVYGLDATRREVQDYLRELARHAVEEWGYDLLDLDFLRYGAAGGGQGRGMSAHEALRVGLRALREGAGRAFLLASSTPQQHALGVADGMRVGGEPETGWAAVTRGARESALRQHLNGRAWYNWPGPLLPGSLLAVEEARAWASIVALTGGVALTFGSLAELPEERLEIVRRSVPVAPIRGRALGFMQDDGLAASQRGPAEGRAPSWIASRVRDDWWMLAAVNWDDEPRRVSLSLVALRIAGPFAVYDVWAEERRPDVASRLALTLQPRSVTVLSIRRPRRFPFVLGTTRHVVQGAVDLAEERWDSRRRTLSGRSVRLDGRPYAVTIAVPPGYHPRRCNASVACGVVHEHRDGRAVRLEIPATREDVEWEVGF